MPMRRDSRDTMRWPKNSLAALVCGALLVAALALPRILNVQIPHFAGLLVLAVVMILALTWYGGGRF
jgi:hypothetical protein